MPRPCAPHAPDRDFTTWSSASALRPPSRRRTQRRLARLAGWLAAAVLTAGAPAAAAPAEPSPRPANGPQVTDVGPAPAGVATASVAAAPSAPRRPRTCLVLSGGGARGLAHIGVLRWLEAERIPVDCIAGTSMGAVIGALYASGLSPARIAETMQELDWVALRLGPDERADRPPRRREEDHVYTLPLDIEVNDGRALLPGSLLGADLFESQLRHWLGHRGKDTVFDRLPIPLRVVATRLGSGAQATLERGDLARAVRASMSAPGLFPPARIGGGLYVDGGLVDNLPIDVARQMGAERVIAVDIGTKAADERDVRTVLDITLQMLTLLTDQNVRAQLATLGPQDVLISPSLGIVSFMDFLRAPEAIEAGGRIPPDKALQLRAMAVTPQEWQRHLLARADRVLANLPQDDLRAADAPAAMPAGAADRPAAASAPMGAAIVPSGAPASPLSPAGPVDARAGEADRSTRIRFGLSLGTDFRTGYFRVAGGLTQPLGEGIEWRSGLELGRVQRLATDLWVPVAGAALVPYADVSRSQLPLYAGRVKILDGEVERAALGLDVGVSDRWGGQWRTGPLIEWVRTGSGESGLLHVDNANGQIDVDRVGTSTARYVSLRSRYQLDTLDAALLPRRGLRMTAELTGGQATAGESGSYRLGSLDAQGVMTVGRDTFELAGQAGQYFGASREALPRWFTLGGFLRLSGYTTDSLAGSDVRFIRAQWRRQVAGLTPLGYRVWFGASAEAGRISEPLIDLGQLPQRTARALTLYAAMETPLGPVWLGAGIPRDGPARLYLFLGQP